MKLWSLATSLTVSLLILSGCGTPKPAAPESAVIDKTLPVVTLTKHGEITGMKSVAFEWKSITNPKVKGIYVYKKSPQKEGKSTLEYYVTIKNRYATHFLDRDVVPATEYTYAFKTYSDKAESTLSRPIVVSTKPVLASVAWIHSITGLPRVAKILWRPHMNERVNGYIIERKSLQEDKFKKIAELDGRLNVEYIDTGLKDNFVYLYRVRAVTYDNIISTPSQSVKVVTKPLPFTVENIKATRNLPNKIEITWAPAKQKDFAYYALYRASKIDGHYKIIAKLLKNSYVDKIDASGKVYFYQVSAFDRDGLESKHEKNAIQGMTLGAPSAPGIIDAKLSNDTITIVWSKVDPRSLKYVVKRIQKEGWFKESVDEYEVDQGTTFIDKNIKPNSTYIYTVFALDKNNIRSQKSLDVKVVTPEAKGLIEEKIAPKSTPKETPQKVSVPKEVKSKEVVSPSDDIDLSGL